MKIAFILIFPLTFIVGLVFRPLPYDSLSVLTIGLLVTSAVSDRLGMWYAKRNRIGSQAEQFGTVESVTYFNSPWARNWSRFRWFVCLITVTQILGILSGTLWCGELVRHIVSD